MLHDSPTLRRIRTETGWDPPYEYDPVNQEAIERYVSALEAKIAVFDAWCAVFDANRG